MAAAAETPWDRSRLLDYLREPNGDIIVRLTPNPAEWLILDRNQLTKGSEMLTLWLKPDWQLVPVVMAHPLTGIQTNMYIFSLIWDGETFGLTERGANQPLPALPPATGEMSPKFRWTDLVLDQDTLADNVHPGLLAAHDLFLMFAILWGLPVALDHFPFRQQNNSEDVIKLGCERLASVTTHLDYYKRPGLDTQIVLKNLLMEYVTAHKLSIHSAGAWLDLLRLSGSLKFPELYVLLILEATQWNLSATSLQNFANILGLTTGAAQNLLDTAKADYQPVYYEHVGSIVHIPLMGLPDWHTTRHYPPGWSWEQTARLNARIYAGSLWEAHMKVWAYWRGLSWRQFPDENPGLRWRQRFPTFPFNNFVCESLGPWPIPRRTM